MDAPHVSVLLGEVMEALEPGPGKLIVDGTFGAGGYSRAFLDAGAQVVAFDRDPTAARFAAPHRSVQSRCVTANIRRSAGRTWELRRSKLSCGP